MNHEIDVEEFVRQFTAPEPLTRAPARRRPAQEIMAAPALPYFGPRLDRGRHGRRRWVARLDRKPDLQRFTVQYPVL